MDNYTAKLHSRAGGNSSNHQDMRLEESTGGDLEEAVSSASDQSESDEMLGQEEDQGGFWATNPNLEETWKDEKVSFGLNTC